MHIVQSKSGNFFTLIILSIFILFPEAVNAANPWDKYKEGTLFELSKDQFGEPMDTEAFRPKPEIKLQTEEKQKTPAIGNSIENSTVKENPETKSLTNPGAEEKPKDTMNKATINMAEKKELKKPSTYNIENVPGKNIPPTPLLKPLLNLIFKISTVILSSIALIFSIKALKTAEDTQKTVSEFIGKV